MRITKNFLVLSMIMALQACGEKQSALQNEELGETLASIKNKEVITLGYNTESIPFSYTVDGQNQPLGFSHDLELKVVNAIKQKLNMPNLKVKYQGMNLKDRLTLVASGVVDLECSTTTNNFKRKNKVDFSVGFFQTSVRLLVRNSSDIVDFYDLTDKTVLVIQGSTAETQLRILNNKGLNATIIPLESNEQIITKLKNSEADALMMDDVLLANIREYLNPSDWTIVGNNDKYEIYGCSLKKGDEKFKALVDETLSSIYASGEINQIYQKWFESAIPPNNISINFPMSLELKELYQNPHDQETAK